MLGQSTPIFPKTINKDKVMTNTNKISDIKEFEDKIELIEKSDISNRKKAIEFASILTNFLTNNKNIQSNKTPCYSVYLDKQRTVSDDNPQGTPLFAKSRVFDTYSNENNLTEHESTYCGWVNVQIFGMTKSTFPPGLFINSKDKVGITSEFQRTLITYDRNKKIISYSHGYFNPEVYTMNFNEEKPDNL